MRLIRSPQLSALLLLAAAAAALAEDDAGTRLREAATRGDVAQVRALLDAGADVNAPSEYGATALFFACDKGHVEVVKLLLARGAKPDVKDTFYQSTAADWAGFKGQGEILKLLAQAGADVTGGVTASASSGKPEGVRPLLDAKMLNDKQLTMVLTAAKGAEQAELVKLLEAAGAKPLPPADAKVDPAILASYVGSYEAATGMRITVSVSAAGALQVAFGDRQPGELAAESDVRFRLKEYELAGFTFESEGGAVRRVKYDEGGELVVFERKTPPATAPAPAPRPAPTPAPAAQKELDP
jgi:hypothetical protein